MDVHATSGSYFKNKIFTRTAAVILNRFGIAILTALLIVAAWAGQTLVVILLGLALATAGLSRLWSHLSLVGVHSERILSNSRVFPDEYIDLKLRIVNRKILPLPWVQITDEVPSAFITELPLAAGQRPGFGIISKSSSLLWYSAISWKHRLFCSKRGYYPLGPLSVTSGDIFGFYPRSGYQNAPDHIIVYPRIYPLHRLALSSMYPLGEAKSEKRLFEDPSRSIGVRNYSPDDSLRKIHWKATARQQTLQVKVFEPSTTLRVAIFMVIESFKYQGVCQEDNLELGISTAASVSKYLIETRSQLGLWANSQLADSGLPSRILPGAGVNQLAQILEALAKVTSTQSGSFIDFFQEEQRSLSLGTSIVFVAQYFSRELKGLLSELQFKGYKLTMFQIGTPLEKQVFPDISWHVIRRPEDLAEMGVLEKAYER